MYEKFKELYIYEPDTGKFYSKRRHRYITPNKRGQLRIFGVMWQASHLAWLYMTGEFPKALVDHKDRNPSNMIWTNLRKASSTQNSMNRSKRSGCSSQYKGVSWCRVRKGWLASIRVNKKLIRLGSFKREEDAASAYRVAAREYFGAFATDGLLD